MLKNIKINNYRSIKEIDFEIEQISDMSFTYGLLGINEAGKSSILEALSFKDSRINTLPKINDFYKGNKEDFQVLYKYEISDFEIEEIKKLSVFESLTKDSFEGVDTLSEEEFDTSFFLDKNLKPSELKKIDLIYTYKRDQNVTRQASISFSEVKDQKFKIFLEANLLQEIEKISHKTTFWKYDPKYLIDNNIPLNIFTQKIDDFIPLRNCFNLIGLPTHEKIKEAIDKILPGENSSEREKLQDDMGTKITEHIKNVWKGHDITITFNISGDILNFHIKENNSNELAEKIDQRSDGFKQFISFILSVSIENTTQNLSNTIILLDEPETHLHPKAQQLFLEELILLTKENNNICFFATHSNYMVDKSNIDRNFLITKDYTDRTNKKTTKGRFDKKNASYAYVNFKAFQIYSTDYHNELYADLEINFPDIFKKKINFTHVLGIEKENVHKNEEEQKKCSDCKKYIKTNKDKTTYTEYISEQKYIRNQIHHPENKNGNERYTQERLEKSINFMLKLISDEKQKEVAMVSKTIKSKAL